MRKLTCLLHVLLLAAMLLLAGCGKESSQFTLVMPQPGDCLTHMRDDWRQVMAENMVKKAEAFSGDIYMDPKGQPVPILFTWETTLPPPYTLEISQDKRFRPLVRTITTDTNSAQVYNLEIGREYCWRVRAGKKCSATRAFTTMGPIRQIFVSATGPVNVRDWGGKEISSGGRTRQGFLYRGTQLQDPFAISEDGKIVMLEELGIRTDLDLRYDNQVKDMTGSPLGPTVKWLHFAVNAYNSFEEANKAVQFPLWCSTMRVFADKDNYPIYFHCWGGVDRTGEVALLLNFLLGVDEEQAFIDYEFSSTANFYRPRTIPYLQQWLNHLKAYAPEGTRQEQVEKYLLDIGLTQEEIDAIRENLTEK